MEEGKRPLQFDMGQVFWYGRRVQRTGYLSRVGVTGEDEWPSAPEAPSVKQEEPQQKIETKEVVYALQIPELPDAYGDNRIILMVMDPEWLFTYWELRQDVIDSARNTLIPLAEGAKTILRVYDVTDIIFNGYNAHKYFDIEVVGGARSWYIPVGEPNRSFCVDIGFLAPDGTFRVLSRSNTVRTPRMGVSGVVDEEWMSIKALYERRTSRWDVASVNRCLKGRVQTGRKCSKKVCLHLSLPVVSRFQKIIIMEKGYLSLILHAHLPFVRHPEYPEFLEEDWLFEAITETYIPLIDVFDKLIDEGIDFRITMSPDPTADFNAYR